MVQVWNNTKLVQMHQHSSLSKFKPCHSLIHYSPVSEPNITHWFKYAIHSSLHVTHWQIFTIYPYLLVIHWFISNIYPCIHCNHCIHVTHWPIRTIHPLVHFQSLSLFTWHSFMQKTTFATAKMAAWRARISLKTMLKFRSMCIKPPSSLYLVFIVCIHA